MAATSQLNGGGTHVFRRCQRCNGYKSSDSELRRPLVIDPVYHLGSTELISKTDGAIAGGFRHSLSLYVCRNSLC
ncbi:hypothetical protein GOBAR_AA05893 [Gossypium barbadense]|uniref:Uncharacterized protein n=1 Tax=Gossypium barbadense TaxID=3634 RepID=A0A2P5YGI6_GOSBA|nr:hypothetical protein GOBAR_AA05893 [Gossypium barbadense]